MLKLPPKRRICVNLNAERSSANGTEWRSAKPPLDNIPKVYNHGNVLLIEGAVMRRQDGGAGRGARGRRQTQPSRSGGAGPRPQAIGPAARSSLMVRSHWLYRGKRGSVPKRAEARPFREANSRQKRGPAAGRRRRGAPKGAGILETECSHTTNWSAAWRATPSMYRGTRKRKSAYPGPQTTRAMTLVCCLKIESRRRQIGSLYLTPSAD
jgi:hypothetical protein